jgi:hypothetical protein
MVLLGGKLAWCVCVGGGGGLHNNRPEGGGGGWGPPPPPPGGPRAVLQSWVSLPLGAF